MRGNAKKILIYARYALPVLSHIVMLVMFFVPSHRFIVGGAVGDCMSLADFISAYWEKSRDVLFGTGSEYTVSDETFSKIMLVAIILFAIFFIVSFAISIWMAIVSFRYFLSDNDEAAEKWRSLFVVFVPNRIVAFILSGIGITIALLPYFITPLSTLTGAGTVDMVLEAPDTLTIGLILLIVSLIVSVCSAFVEKYVGADVFKKLQTDDETDEDEQEDEEDDPFEDD